ncbi:MAG: SRPBCC family protein [Gemmatimonadaceae bacterium]|nr:SRPBCC family protein [Gemmatimonadaceae bacterium]
MKERVRITPRGEREIQMIRTFSASRDLVFDAFTKPELVRRWLLGPDGWSMPICEMDLRVGGNYRWVWKSDKDGTTMGVGGTYREITRPDRLVNTEKFDDAWYPGESINTTEFVEKNGKTTMTSTMLYESREARDGVLKSDMERGVNDSYDRLEDLLLAEKR